LPRRPARSIKSARHGGVSNWRRHFDPSKFEDRYENALIDLLKKKEAGEKIEPAKEGPAPRVVNLMDALRASIDAEKKKAPAPSSKAVGLLKRRQAKGESPLGIMTSVELDSSALKSSVAFTGRLACMTRAEAFAVVHQHGGKPNQAVTKQTKLLIVGELGWPLLDDGRPSNKLSRAVAYGVPVVSERRFLEWIGKVTPDIVHKTYSAEQLAALSRLSNDTIRELAQFGLLDERGGHFGFRELASARQIAKLLADGVRLSEIIRSVNAIKKWLPDRERCELVAARQKRKPHCALPRGSIRRSHRLGTTFLTCWTSRDAQRPPSNAYAQRCVSRLATWTQCSTWPCCCNEKTNTWRPPVIGAAISLPMPNRNGPRGLVDH
jgi:hypothetical protein